jgi:tRNA threonylcarbamoyladenosine biosynthesis protein TsaE
MSSPSHRAGSHEGGRRSPLTRVATGEQQTRQIGRELALTLGPGDVVLFSGPLGAGKTTMIRGMLEGLGHIGPVRSPTFNLIQTFDTWPPVMHADLYRMKDHRGTGIEDYLDTHLCLIEWPDRALGLLDPVTCWQVEIQFSGEDRVIDIEAPKAL